MAARPQPFQVLAAPIAHCAAVSGSPGIRGFQQTDSINDESQPRGVNYADVATLGSTGNGLAELQVRVHPGRSVQEPRAQQLSRVGSIRLVVRKVPGQRKSFHRRGHPAEDQPVRLIRPRFRVDSTIAADIGQTVRLLGVRPPVWPEAHIVVLIAAGRGQLLVHHRRRTHF